MYTDPAYQRRSVAYHILNLLVEVAKHRGITDISLESTDMGHPLYETYGSVRADREMKLPV